MCGFAGWFDLRPGAPPPASDARRRALDLLAARGPDGEGEQVAADGSWGLLHRRLAIVDRDGGAQPMAGPRPGSWLAWNGELFDQDARRDGLRAAGRVLRTRSDTEVLAHTLDAHGDAALADLAGNQFALAWIAEHEGTPRLLLARDPAGEKPLFLARHGDRLLFASTLDAVRALGQMDVAIEPEALSLYLSWGFVPAPLTIFRGVSKLAAGECVAARRPETVRRWCPPPAPREPEESEGDAVDRLRGALALAARRRLESSDVPVGLMLSGGLDSLAVAAVLHDAAALRTFTVRASDPRYDESADAARSAAVLGVAHTVIDPPSDDPDAWRRVLLRFGEPFGSTSALAVDAVARAARDSGVTVVLTGDGGDEALGGYPRHVLLRRLASLPRLPRWMAPADGALLRRARRAATLLTQSPADRYAAMYEVFGDVRAQLTAGDDGGAARDRIRALWGRAAAGDLAAMLTVDRALELPDSHCVKLDVACMGNGVEPRSPWLDPDVVAMCDELPARWRIRGTRTKVALRELIRRELIRRELVRRELRPSAVREILGRRKRGFTTGFDSALAGTAVRDLLLGDALARVPGLDVTPVATLLEEHRAGRGNHRFRLGVLTGLALFADVHLR